MFCVSCRQNLPWIAPPICVKCGMPYLVASAADAHRFVGRPCHECRRRSKPFMCARSVFEYRDAAANAIRALKFRGHRRLARPLGRLMAEKARDIPGFLDGITLVVPVPLHPRRMAERGFNQSALLAGEIARTLGLQLATDALVRVRETETQTSLDRKKRLVNVRGAFAAREHPSLGGAHILLVDDVMTTGATAEACSRALRSSGARSIKVISLARD